MILRGLTSSAPVQGVTVQDPVDVGAPTGFSPVAANNAWFASPSPNFAVSALGTVTTAANIDWTAAGLYTLTLTAANTCVVTFGIGSSSGANSFNLGQMIAIQVTGASTAAITWPSAATITWIGSGSSSAPTVTGNVTLIFLICTGTGSSPTFTGFYLTN